jgi:hypothetical protein
LTTGHYTGNFDDLDTGITGTLSTNPSGSITLNKISNKNFVFQISDLLDSNRRNWFEIYRTSELYRFYVYFNGDMICQAVTERGEKIYQTFSVKEK